MSSVDLKGNGILNFTIHMDKAFRFIFTKSQDFKIYFYPSLHGVIAFVAKDQLRSYLIDLDSGEIRPRENGLLIKADKDILVALLSVNEIYHHAVKMRNAKRNKIQHLKETRPEGGILFIKDELGMPFLFDLEKGLYFPGNDTSRGHAIRYNAEKKVIEFFSENTPIALEGTSPVWKRIPFLCDGDYDEVILAHLRRGF